MEEGWKDGTEPGHRTNKYEEVTEAAWAKWKENGNLGGLKERKKLELKLGSKVRKGEKIRGRASNKTARRVEGRAIEEPEGKAWHKPIWANENATDRAEPKWN